MPDALLTELRQAHARQAEALAAVARELAALRALVDARLPAPAVPLAERLLTELRGAFEAEPFDAAAVIDLARVNLSTRAPLRAVVAEVVRDHHAVGAARRLGRHLAGLVDQPAGRFRLEHLRTRRGAALYRVALAASVAPETCGAFSWPRHNPDRTP